MSGKYTFRPGDLPKLDLQVDRGSDFKAWRSQWSAYLNLSGLSKEPPEMQVQALTLCFARETVTIVDNLGLTDAQRSDVAEIVAAIQRYVEGQVNESVERRTFRKRVQQPGETFDDFLVSLRELSKTCKFCSEECVRKSIRDQIIEGLSEGDTVEALLRERDLTLDTAISKCRTQEAARKQRAAIINDSDNAQIRAVRKQVELTQNRPQKTCVGCGSAPHPGGRQNCPAFGRICRKCQIVGHLARVCMGGRKPTQGNSRPPPYKPQNPGMMAVQIDQETDGRSPEVNASAVTGTFEPAPTIEVQMTALNGSSTMSVLPDSGADISVAGLAMLHSLNEHPDNLEPSSVTPRAVNGTTMSPIGKLQVCLSLGPTEYTDIYPQVKGALLSWKAAKSLRILPNSYPQPPL